MVTRLQAGLFVERSRFVMLDDAHVDAVRSRLLDGMELSATGCWEWRRPLSADGYGVITFKGHSFAAHRVAYTLFVGEIPKGLCVCHHCDNRRCCNPSHLFTGTALDNNRDRNSKGRQAKGEQCRSTKLSVSVVCQMRLRHAQSGLSAGDLAAEFGVCRTTAWRIVARKIWKHC